MLYFTIPGCMQFFFVKATLFFKFHCSFSSVVTGNSCRGCRKISSAFHVHCSYYMLAPFVPSSVACQQGLVQVQNPNGWADRTGSVRLKHRLLPVGRIRLTLTGTFYYFPRITGNKPSLMKFTLRRSRFRVLHEYCLQMEVPLVWLIIQDRMIKLL